MIKNFFKNNPPSVLSRDIVHGRIISLPKKGFFPKLLEFINEFLFSCTQTDLFGVCAQMAFTLLFALLPTLLFIILICSQFVPNFDEIFYSLIQILLPSAGFEYISLEIDFLFSYLNRIGTFIFILSAFMGTLSAHTFLIGINQTYGFDIYRSKRWEWIKSFIVLLVFVLTLSFLTLAFIYIGRIAQRALITRVSFFRIFNLNQALYYTLLIIGMMIILLGFYIYTPQRRIRIREAIPGTIFSTLGILIIFRIYIVILNHSTNYILVYGSLSGLFLLLTAFYFICVILNLGAKLNVFFSFKLNTLEYGKITNK